MIATVNMVPNTKKKEKKKTQTRPSCSLDRLCYPGVFQRERHRHISIRKRQRINREDLDKMQVNDIYLFSDGLVFSVIGGVTVSL